MIARRIFIWMPKPLLQRANPNSQGCTTLRMDGLSNEDRGFFRDEDKP